MNSIGELIAQKRKECGMTQKQLAEILHLTSSAISKWETGTAVPHISQFPQIAETLQIPVTELYALTIEDFRYQTSEVPAETDIPAIIEEDLENAPVEIPSEESTNGRLRSTNKLLFTIICVVVLILLTLGTALYISKSSNKQPVLKIVNEYYSEDEESYGYNNIYYIIIDYEGNISEDFLQSYKNELLDTYLDKFVQASIIIVKFYNEYSISKINDDPDMKLVLLPPRKE